MAKRCRISLLIVYAKQPYIDYTATSLVK